MPGNLPGNLSGNLPGGGREGGCKTTQARHQVAGSEGRLGEACAAMTASSQV